MPPKSKKRKRSTKKKGGSVKKHKTEEVKEMKYDREKIADDWYTGRERMSTLEFVVRRVRDSEDLGEEDEKWARSELHRLQDEIEPLVEKYSALLYQTDWSGIQDAVAGAPLTTLKKVQAGAQVMNTFVDKQYQGIRDAMESRGLDVTNMTTWFDEEERNLMDLLKMVRE